MKLTFASARRSQQFAIIFANLKNFTDNVSIYFRDDNIYIQCLDDSHCCLFEAQLMNTWFKEYTFDAATDQACVGVNIAMLNKVLATWNDTQEMSIEIDPETDKICINYENGNVITGQFNKYFELSLIDIESELMDVRIAETLVDLTIESKVFCSLISQLTIFDNNLTLTFNEENIECVSSGSDGSMKAMINVAEVKEYAIPESTVLKQSYSLRYVQMMCQFNKLATEMELGFSATMPMLMKYGIGDNNDSESFVRIHLAPKIIDSDD
jgi:proliferating cell nuclear antigen PCNA